MYSVFKHSIPTIVKAPFYQILYRDLNKHSQVFLLYMTELGRRGHHEELPHRSADRGPRAAVHEPPDDDVSPVAAIHQTHRIKY